MIFFLFLELGTRLGAKFIPSLKLFHKESKTINYMKQDEELGWVHSEGKYSFQRYGDKKIINVSLNKEGDRAIPEFLKKDQNVLMLGCSYFEGFGLDDNDTIALHLENSLLNTNVLNFSTSGYGTYQNLLLLKRLLENKDFIKNKPKIAIYGFIEHHELRNVGDRNYRRVLAYNSSNINSVMPYCRLENDNLECRKPEYIYNPYLIKSPLYSVRLISTLEIFDKFYSLKKDEPKIVTENIIIQIKNLLDKNEIPFLFTILDSKNETFINYNKFAQTNNVSLADCRYEEKSNPKYLLPDKEHPNELATPIIAKCLAENILKTTK